MNSVYLIYLLLIDYIFYPVMILFLLKYIKNRNNKIQYMEEEKEKESEFNRYTEFAEINSGYNYSKISSNFMYNSDYKKARENNLFNVMYLFEVENSNKKFYFFDLLAQSENKIIHYNKVKNISISYFVNNKINLERISRMSDIIYVDNHGLFIYDGISFIRLLNDEMFTNIISTARSINGGNMASLNLMNEVHNQINIHNNSPISYKPVDKNISEKFPLEEIL